MALLKIARMGHPVLRAPAAPVDDPAAPEIRRLISDMVETMEDADGAGLAAPQVHVPLRLVVMRAREDAAEEGIVVLVNPVIEPLGPGLVSGFEACLSVPGLGGMVPRFDHVRLSARDRANAPIEREVRGYEARVLQHECDHLDGILYPQRMSDLSSLVFVSELGRGEETALKREAEL